MDLSAFLANDWVRIAIAVTLVFFVLWLFQKLLKFLLIAGIVGLLIWHFWLS